MSKWTKLQFSFLCLTLLVASFASAQRFDGTLRGTVTDASGALVPNAKVVARNNDTGTSSSAITSSAGLYTITNLLVGAYTVTVEASGFGAYQRDAVQVLSAQTVEVNVALSVSGVSQSVEVQAGANVLQTESSQLTGTFEARQVTELPTMFGANGFGSVQNLVIYLPNTTSQLGGTSGNGGSVGGLRGRQNNFTIDGATNTDQTTSVSSIEVIQDAVAEFAVSTNQFTAEFGGAAGGQFNVVTRTGGNQYHGGAWWYGSNRNFNAISSQEAALIASGSQPGKSRFDYNKEGGRIGGPILKDKLFFFGAYEHQSSGNQPSAPSELMPTAQGMALAMGLAANAQVKALLTQFPIAPANDQGTVPVTVKGVTTQIPVGNVISQASSFLDDHQYVINLDYNRDSHQLRFRQINDRIRTPTLGLFPQQQFNSLTGVDNRRVVVNDVWNLSNKAVNDVKFTFGRLANVSTLSGIAATYPNVIINNDLGASIGPATQLPQFRYTNWYQLADSVTYARGIHTLKAGGEYRWTTSPSVFLSNQRGQYGYQTLNALINDQVPDFAGFTLQGIGDGSFAGNAKNVAWFVQDDVKVSHRLTLNLGLRYDFFGIPKDANANIRNSIADCPSCGLVFHKPANDYNNFGPRAGFAWDPTGSGKWSVRGGVGVSYDQIPYNFFTNGAPPEKQATLNPTNACAGTFSAAPSWCSTGANFLASGALVQPFLPPSTTAAARAVTANIMPDNRSSKVFNWSLGVQREIMKDTVIEVRYLGTRALELPIQFQRNAISAFDLGAKALPTYFSNSAIPATVAASAPTRAGFIAAEGQRYASQGFFGVITDYNFGGTSRYHGGSIDINRRMSKGLQARFNYTLSRAQDNSTNDLNTSRINPRRPEDTNNLANEWGRSTLDIHQKVSATWIFDVPGVTGMGKALKFATSGWQWDATYLYQGGQPITVQSGVDANGNGDSAGDRSIVNPAGIARTGTAVSRVCRDAATGATSVNNACANNLTVGYVANNPNARYVQAQTGARTTAGRNTENSSPINVWNMGFVRLFKVRENMTAQVRADMYDVFNQQVYALAPASIFGVNTNAQSTSYANVTSPLFLNSSQFDSGSRTIQLGVKFIF